MGIRLAFILCSIPNTYSESTSILSCGTLLLSNGCKYVNMFIYIELRHSKNRTARGSSIGDATRREWLTILFKTILLRPEHWGIKTTLRTALSMSIFISENNTSKRAITRLYLLPRSIYECSHYTFSLIDPKHPNCIWVKKEGKYFWHPAESVNWSTCHEVHE